MKILFINSVQYGSTGNIVLKLAQTAERAGDTCYVAVPKGRHNRVAGFHNTVWIGNRFSEDSHILLGRLTGNCGGYSRFATKNFIRKLRAIKPDIIHIHNLHNSYINLPLLFRYIRDHDVKTVWTLHDCWSFTGHCPHYSMIGCEKWKTGCSRCPQYREYPPCYVDNSASQYRKKQQWFCGLKHLTLVAPSDWLARQIRQSFLREYPVKVIRNGTDLSVFRPTESDFRERHTLQGKYIVLGVAFGWDVRKGLDVFVALSARLDRSRYQIVLVGTDAKTDRLLPDSILSVHRTQNRKELAELYTAADVFVNPTREEVFGLVNVEALACGTPGVTFDTGGSPECYDETCGAVVPCGDVDAMEQAIVRICGQKPFSPEACIRKAREFDGAGKFQEYMKLYRSLLP